jgi:hypothetical protein
MDAYSVSASLSGAVESEETNMIRIAIGTVAIATLLGVGVGAAYAAEGPYSSEATARACITKRMAELVADQSRDVTGDPSLQACTNDLKAEMKSKGKSDCDAAGYIGWVVASENSKRYHVTAQPYKPDKAFLAQCEKPAK